jgi:hypothetical protein
VKRERFGLRRPTAALYGSVFRWYQEMLEHILLNRVKRKVLLLGIASGRIKATKNWNMGSWRYGATLTGDVGHQVQADLDPARLRLGPPED